MLTFFGKKIKIYRKIHNYMKKWYMTLVLFCLKNIDRGCRERTNFLAPGRSTISGPWAHVYGSLGLWVVQASIYVCTRTHMHLHIYIYTYIYIYIYNNYIYIYIYNYMAASILSLCTATPPRQSRNQFLRCSLFGSLKLALPGLMNLS